MEWAKRSVKGTDFPDCTISCTKSIFLCISGTVVALVEIIPLVIGVVMINSWVKFVR